MDIWKKEYFPKRVDIFIIEIIMIHHFILPMWVINFIESVHDKTVMTVIATDEDMKQEALELSIIDGCIVEFTNE